MDNTDVRLIASLVFYTGMRTGEARAIGDDLRDGSIRVDETASDAPQKYGLDGYVAPPKTGRVRNVPYPDLLSQNSTSMSHARDWTKMTCCSPAKGTVQSPSHREPYQLPGVGNLA